MQPHDAPSRDGERVQQLLRGGLGAAAALMALGLAVQLASGVRGSVSVEMFGVGAAGIPLGERLMALGILVLAFTPVLRVVVLIALWTKERDWRFVAVAVAVLLTLSAAIAAGGG